MLLKSSYPYIRGLFCAVRIIWGSSGYIMLAAAFLLFAAIVITADGLKVEAPFLSESYTPEPELIIEEAPEE